MTARVAAGIVAMLGLAASLAACGAGESPAAGRPAESEVAAVRSQLAASPRTEAEVKSASDDHFRQYNQMLAECMGKAGFRFQPVGPPEGLRQSLGLTEEAYRRQYGFGISTLIEARLLQQGGKKDPNAAYAATLSAQAQRAYNDSYGACQEQALRKLGPPPGMQILSAAMNNVLERAEQAMLSDQRLVQAKQKFGDCLVRQGYSARTTEDLTKEINERVAPLRVAVEQRINDVRKQGGDPKQVRAEQVLSAAQRTELEALRRYELAAAAAVGQCERDGADVEAVQTKVQREYIERFLDQS